MDMNNTFSNSTDWMQFYQSTLTGQGHSQAARSSVTTDATVVSTTLTSPTTAAGTNSLNPEGRVSKPARRRRASRAAPTTLVNTDTTNFRSMVQQFTGISNPSLTFGTRTEAHQNAQNIDFRTIHCQNTTANMNPNAHSGYINHYQQQQQQQQGYMFSSFNNSRANSDGFLMENTSSTTQMFPRSSSSSHNNNGYIQ